MFWNKDLIQDIVDRALKEDFGTGGDITSDNLLSAQHQSKGIILAKQKGVIAGLKVAAMVFESCNNELIFKPLLQDGDMIEPGDKIAEVEGVTRDILKGERTALNFLQRLSGIATNTKKYVDKVKNHPVRITDTRKTTPTLRVLEKYAVKVGGGYNHRMGLFDAVLIKDNHIQAAGGIKKAINTIRTQIPHTTKIEIEVENMPGVKKALTAEADIIMLDNMELKQMEKAVAYIDKKALVEASGGITLRTINEIAATGVDVISVGALTHQIRSLDLSLNL